MTVSYQYDVASSTSGGFTRLLLKWRGSLYKLIYREIIFFLVVFAFVSLIYRYLLNEHQQRYFETLVLFFEKYLEMIPLSFVLGFYVTTIATRWWQQYVALPWPDKLMLCVSLYIPGRDEESRLVRRTLVRYTNLMMILVLRSISLAVKRRFPTLEHVVESGIMTKKELERFVSVQTEFNTYWIPSCWFVDLLRECRYKKMILDPPGMRLIMEEFLDIRSKCSLLWSYDWISIPLVYTQVVTLATYTFYLACVVARQNVITENHDKLEVDDYFPVFTVFQLLFYMGLLKVAEQMINPFGDDDEDFELNFLIDRHTKVSYLVVDSLHQNSPLLEKDIHFDDVDPTLPYTEASVHHKKDTYRGSAADMIVPQKKQTLTIPAAVDESIDEESFRSFCHRDEHRGITLDSISERLSSRRKDSFNHKSLQRSISGGSRPQENSGYEADFRVESGLRSFGPPFLFSDAVRDHQPKNNLSCSPSGFAISKRKYSTSQRPSLFQSQMLNKIDDDSRDSKIDIAESEPNAFDRPVPARRSKRDLKSMPLDFEKQVDGGTVEEKEECGRTGDGDAKPAVGTENDEEDDGL